MLEYNPGSLHIIQKKCIPKATFGSQDKKLKTQSCLILIYSKMHDVQHLLYSTHTQEQCIVLELMAIKKFIGSPHYKGRELWDILLCKIFLLKFKK